MGSRILTMKRQAAELGRIRTGYSRPNPNPDKGPIPVKSKTFVLTSHSREYVAAAAKLYGGKVEQWTPQRSTVAQWRVITEAPELQAILPAGDVLNQSYEKWGGGGCERRCDGVTEQITRQPCVCLATYGEEWHRRSPRQVCRPTSRIGVFLPDMPDLGVWRLETKSYYAADVLAGGLDTVLEATGGTGMLPVRMWIEQRTAVRDGETKNFPVVMVVPALPKLRHALTGPISTAAALDPSSLDRPAIEAAPAERPDYLADARECRTSAEVREVWKRANRAGHVARDGSDELSQDLMRIAEDIDKGIDPRTGETGEQDGDDVDEPGPDADGVYDVEVLGDDEPGGTEPPVADPSSVSWPAAAQPGQGARS
ncbi:recombination directionality factor [Streptomyces sp. enrichment culture]|uniref:recombination directionality factor n=1 Tax=Streptomyces sp. enrichment culture TaxID=1795815 RepID=UPI003F55FB0F